MCEVAVVAADRYTVDELVKISEALYKSMGDALGILGVHRDPQAGVFRYSEYKDTHPRRSRLYSFFENDEPAPILERYIIHGRLATSGAERVEQAHPLHVNCSECDIDHVIHNGIVHMAHANNKQRLTKEGHEYTTDVDSETIAHLTGEVPPTFDGVRNEFRSEPCYILANNERIYAKTNRRYLMTDDFRMAAGRRWFGPDKREASAREVIVTPEGAPE